MKIGSLFGIEITVHVSWIFVFALVAWALANPVGPLHPAIPNAALRALFGVLGSLLFFASVLAHELAHSLLARSRGVAVRGITLFVFGGVSMFEGEAADAPGEAWISGIGPVTSLVLGGLFAGLAWVAQNAALGALFGYLSAANLMLAIFNLLPAYPLDGGRVLHALVWRATGDRERAGAVAGSIGRAIAFAMIAAGIADALLAEAVGGLWITFIGWFLLQAGNAERSGERLAAALKGHNAGDLAAPPELHVVADTAAPRALDLMQQSQVEAVPVLLGERMIGVLPLEELLALGPDELAGTPVTALMRRTEALETIPASMPADEALKRLVGAPGNVLAVSGADGEAVTIFTTESAMRYLAGMRRPVPASHGNGEGGLGRPG